MHYQGNDNSQALYHFKYISRRRVGDRWVYEYNDPSKKVKQAERYEQAAQKRYQAAHDRKAKNENDYRYQANLATAKVVSAKMDAKAYTNTTMAKLSKIAVRKLNSGSRTISNAKNWIKSKRKPKQKKSRITMTHDVRLGRTSLP